MFSKYLKKGSKMGVTKNIKKVSQYCKMDIFDMSNSEK